MKRIIVLAGLILVSAEAHAGPVKTIATYFTNSVIVNAATNAGSTGLSTGQVYLCFLVSELTNSEASVTQMTGDVRVAFYRLVDHLADRISAQASTNRFVYYTINQLPTFDANYTTRTIKQTIQVQQSMTYLPSYPSE